MCTDVYRPEQGFEEQCCVLAPHFWRVGTGAYQCDAETCSLELYFFVHVGKLVMSTIILASAEVFLDRCDGVVVTDAGCRETRARSGEGELMR